MNLDIKYFLNDSLKSLIIFLQELENEQMTMMKSISISVFREDSDFKVINSDQPLLVFPTSVGLLDRVCNPSISILYLYFLYNFCNIVFVGLFVFSLYFSSPGVS